MPSPIDTPTYWIEDFKPSAAELDALYEEVLDAGRPLTIDALAAALIRIHVTKLLERRRVDRSAGGTIYQPADRYEPGQKLVFPALDGAQGVVEGVRPGNNPDYGLYEVIQVRMGGTLREFAAGLAQPHALLMADADVDPHALARRFDAVVASQLATLLATDREWVHLGDRWILKALLPEVNAGHLNLAEAIILLAGEPLPSAQILTELDLDAGAPLETRAMALELALAGDARFRNVGSRDAPLWTVTTQVG